MSSSFASKDTKENIASSQKGIEEMFGFEQVSGNIFKGEYELPERSSEPVIVYKVITDNNTFYIATYKGVAWGVDNDLYDAVYEATLRYDQAIEKGEDNPFMFVMLQMDDYLEENAEEEE